MLKKSPFPGMDPYLESHWGDVHHRLITYSCDQIQDELPDELLARVEERVYVEGGADGDRNMYPDVRVIEQGRSGRRSSAGASAVAFAEPIIVKLPDEPITEGFIQILDARSNNRIVTCIEFLSPTNKSPGRGREEYIQKQREMSHSGVSFVEIDLLREGKHVLVAPKVKQSPYMACVRRGWDLRIADVYPISLREPLPTIRIPLRVTDADVPLNLQAILETCYRNGRYGTIDYSVDPEPPLTSGDARWTDKLLRAKGLRKGKNGKR